MDLVLQGNYHESCQQACCAMLAGVKIEDIINVVGSDRMCVSEHEKVLEHFGVSRVNSGTIVKSYGKDCIGELIRKNTTLWITVNDLVDKGFAHAVLLHNKKLYDPCCGMNPTWPWSRYMTLAYAVRCNCE